LAFNMAGIIGSFCAYDCDLAGDHYSLTRWFYLSAACISLFSLLVIKREHVSVINNGLSLQTKMTSIFFSIWSCYNKPIICSGKLMTIEHAIPRVVLS
jgi:hypothetical protein